MTYLNMDKILISNKSIDMNEVKNGTELSQTFSKLLNADNPDPEDVSLNYIDLTNINLNYKNFIIIYQF